MKFFKNVKGFTKGLAKGIRKGLSTAENVVNAVDKATGGALRQTAASLTGGLSERGLDIYKANKGNIKKALDVGEGKANVKQALQGTKYEGKFNKYEKGYRDIKKITDTARSTELGRNVLNKGEGFGRKALGI